MGFQLFWIVLFAVLPQLFSEQVPDVTVTIQGSATIANIDDSFVCATVDWWPPEKCNYNQCPWGQSSALNLDLTHPFLVKAVQAFDVLRIRVGGSLQDQVVYGMPNLGYPCHPFSKKAGGLFGFSEGCLSMERWDELNLFFQQTGAVITFGLNALYGRHHGRGSTWIGDWNSSNARDFIEYTISKEYPIDSWEFGNELSGSGVSASVSAEQYSKDLIGLKGILMELYKHSSFKPLLVAPGGFFEQQWYAKLLDISGLGIVDAMTHHIYNLGGGDDPHIEDKIMDPQYLSRVEDTFRNLQFTIQRHGPWASPWVGEAGGAYNSGSRRVSNKFLNSFWYLDQLGMASKYDSKSYCRQTLIGGNYGLLDKISFIPNPDYYSALLWHRLMGRGVLSTAVSGSSMLRAYAHCRKGKAGITVLLINLSRSTWFHVRVQKDSTIVGIQEEGTQKNELFSGLRKTASWVGRKALDGSETREEYHLTGKDGNHLSQTVLLNGTPLQLTEDGDIPPLEPVFAPADSPVSLAPLSIAFVAFPTFEARACL